MGYHTDYMLNIDGKGWEEVHDLVMKEIDQGDLSFCTWYDHEKDMIEISKKYPKHIFKLYGVGEAGEDLWVKYFKNGECQADPTKIIYPDCKFVLDDDMKEE